MSSGKEVMRKKPKWVKSFIQKPFFEKCSIHKMLKNYQARLYCINCDKSHCKSCIAGGDHNGHMILTIYRHAYQDVIPLSELEMTALDCSEIQPYKSNKQWVLSMKPLPHNGSGSLIEGKGACVVCKRKLTNSDSFRFCCITCKFGQVRTTYKANLIRASEPGVGTSRKTDAKKHSYRKKGKPIRPGTS